MLQKAFDLIDEVLSVPIIINDGDLVEDCPQVVLLHLLRSQQALHAVRLVLADGLYGPAVVLSRHLFELAVNIRYLEKDAKIRVPLYLKHSSVSSTLEEAVEIDQELQPLKAEEDHGAISELLIPGRSWRPMAAMCEELGCLDHYRTMYRSASELAHGGAHRMAKEIMELSGRQQRPNYELPSVLLTALIYYGWVVEISCKIFPHLKGSFQFDATWGDSIKILEDQVMEEARTYIDVDTRR